LRNSVDFGVFTSTEKPTYQEILAEVKEFEHLRYHSVWFSDHLIGMYSSPDAPRFENWTVLSAIAGATSRIRLGQLVLCNPFRHPSLLAKMSATLDAISGGRLELGLGAGWHEPEFKAYGYPFEEPSARVRRLSEAVRIIKRMWTEPSPSFKGRYYSIENAYCSPKPVQKPHPRLMIGGSGEQLLLRVVAKYADTCNFAAWQGSPKEYEAKLRVLARHCRRVKRDPETIRGSWATYALVQADPKDARKAVEDYVKQRLQASPNASPERLRPPISGTPEDCVEQIQRYLDVGVSLFILRFMGTDNMRQAEIFAKEVMPAFK